MQQSPRDAAAEIGDDWKDIVDETVEDNGYAIEQAIERSEAIKKKYPDAKVDWREVMSLPTPDRVNVSLSSVLEQSSQNQPQPPPAKEPQNA